MDDEDEHEGLDLTIARRSKRARDNGARDDASSFPEVKDSGRKEDCPKTAEEARRDPEIHLAFLFIVDEKEGQTLACLVARDKETKAVFSAGGAEDIDGRMDLPEVDGVAPRSRSGVRGPHRDVGQRTRSDEFGRVLERTVQWGSSKSNGTVQRVIQCRA